MSNQLQSLIVWQRFCEPARLRIAYCPWVRSSVVIVLFPHIFCGSENRTWCPPNTLQIHYRYSPLPDKLSAEDRSLCNCIMHCNYGIHSSQKVTRHPRMSCWTMIRKRFSKGIYDKVCKFFCQYGNLRCLATSLGQCTRFMSHFSFSVRCYLTTALSSWACLVQRIRFQSHKAFYFEV